MCVHICVSFPTRRSGGFQSSSHQKHPVFKHFFLQVDNGMISKSLVYQNKKSSQKFTTLLIIFSISAQWTFFFFLQKNKTVPWWLKLKQNKTTATATFYSMQHCNTWIGATASLWETWPNCMLSSSVPNAFTKHRATRTPQDCGPSHSCCLQCAIVFSFGKLLKHSLLYMVPWFIFTL